MVWNLDLSPGWVAPRFVEEGTVQGGSARVLPIAANGTILIDDPEFSQPDSRAERGTVAQGHVEIVSSGIRLVGNVTFGDGERLSPLLCPWCQSWKDRWFSATAPPTRTIM